MPRENILQLLPDAVAPSKEQLAAYWKKVWKHALPYLGRRPLKLVRHANGTISITRRSCRPSRRQFTPSQSKARRRRRHPAWVDDLAGFLGLVEIGAVELHPWNARIDDIEHPDMLVFDLDPGEGVAGNA